MLILILLAGAFLLYFLEHKLYRKLWNRGLNIQVKFAERSAFEGDKSSLTEVVENRSFLPLPFVHAKFRIGSGLKFDDTENMSTSDQNYKNDIFSILFYQRITRTLNFTCAKRGFYPVSSADITSTDLFYKEHLVCAFPQNTFFYAYPGRVDLSVFDQPLKKMIGEMTSRTFLYPDPFEFKGLRDYTISDPMNTINWKASAKTGDLMVNLYDSTTSRRVVIFLNLEDETIIHHDKLHEASIRIASTLIAHLLSEGYPVRLICNGRDIETLEQLPLLDANGPAQTEDIYRMLARIDLNRMPAEFFPMVEKQSEEPDFATAGYIMISTSMKQELQDAYYRITDETGGIWVSPLYENMDLHVTAGDNVDVIKWEVPGFA